MAVCEPFPIEGTVTILHHAVERARERDPICMGMSNGHCRASIEARLREAVRRGQVFDEKPKGFRVAGERMIAPWQRFVRDLTGDWGWIVALDQLPDVVVVTSVVRLPKFNRK